MKLKNKWFFVVLLMAFTTFFLASSGNGGMNMTYYTGIDGGYVGSSVCGICHSNVKADFDKSGHPYKIRTTQGKIPGIDIQDPLSALLSSTMPWTVTLNDDASVPETDVNADGYLDWSAVNYVIGGFGWKARWGIRDESGGEKTGYIWSSATAPSGTSGAQFNMLAADISLDLYSERPDWDKYGSTTGQTKKYDCAICHNTNGTTFDSAYDCYTPAGGRTQPWASNTAYTNNGNALTAKNPGGYRSEWTFDGVQCEACHGTGETHANSPSRRNIAVDTSKAFCGKCHSRGTNIPPASGFTKRDECPSVNNYGAVASGSDFISHHEQYNEMVGVVDSVLNEPGVHKDLSCTSCHNSHKRAHKVTSAIANALGITDNDFSAEERGAIVSCKKCHNLREYRTMYHTTVKCIDCHMAEATKSATGKIGTWGKAGDVKTHIFKIDPNAAINTVDPTHKNEYEKQVATNYLTVKYACGKCHDSSILNSYVGISLTEDDAKAAAVGIHRGMGMW
ncbi:MAG: hypothetical protein HY752_01910 [Nitrospirae bacterium]|nr:hypothetical protein [Nitrospirota bacterium]